MKRLLTILVFALCLGLTLPASAQHRRRNPDLGTIRKDRFIGVGFGAGTLASGLSAKYIVGDAIAFQANLGTCHRCDAGWRWGRYGGFALSVDALLEMPALHQNEMVRVGWNLGAGVGLGVDDFSSSLGLAGALVAGVTFEFQPIPIDLVIEYRPSLRIFSGYYGGVRFVPIEFTAHLRFYLL